MTTPPKRPRGRPPLTPAQRAQRARQRRTDGARIARARRFLASLEPWGASPPALPRPVTQKRLAAIWSDEGDEGVAGQWTQRQVQTMELGLRSTPADVLRWVTGVEWLAVDAGLVGEDGEEVE